MKEIRANENDEMKIWPSAHSKHEPYCYDGLETVWIFPQISHFPGGYLK
jgi:hypothetical protein